MTSATIGNSAIECAILSVVRETIADEAEVQFVAKLLRQVFVDGKAVAEVTEGRCVSTDRIESFAYEVEQVLATTAVDVKQEIGVKEEVEEPSSEMDLPPPSDDELSLELGLEDSDTATGSSAAEHPPANSQLQQKPQSFGKAVVTSDGCVSVESKRYPGVTLQFRARESRRGRISTLGASYHCSACVDCFKNWGIKWTPIFVANGEILGRDPDCAGTIYGHLCQQPELADKLKKKFALQPEQAAQIKNEFAERARKWSTYQEEVPGSGTRNKYQDVIPGTSTRNRYQEQVPGRGTKKTCMEIVTYTTFALQPEQAAQIKNEFAARRLSERKRSAPARLHYAAKPDGAEGQDNTAAEDAPPKVSASSKPSGPPAKRRRETSSKPDNGENKSASADETTRLPMRSRPVLQLKNGNAIGQAAGQMSINARCIRKAKAEVAEMKDGGDKAENQGHVTALPVETEVHPPVAPQRDVVDETAAATSKATAYAANFGMAVKTIDPSVVLYENIFGDNYVFKLVQEKQVAKDGVAHTICTYRCQGCMDVKARDQIKGDVPLVKTIDGVFVERDPDHPLGNQHLCIS